MATLDARHALLSRLIDHAPLFPPASLPLEAALEEDLRAQTSPWSFVLGRFVCPASRLSALPDPGRGFSAVLDGPIPPGMEVEAVEGRFRDDLGPLATLADEVYVEVPLDGALEDRLDALAANGLCAKVRCGGESVPGVGELAAFVRGCRARGVAFKATAGLHHAVHGEAEHGFVNLLAAAVFGDEEAALAEDDPDAFSLDSASFRWRREIAATDELSAARRRLHAIGSCSFFEPVEELEAMGVGAP